MAASEVLLAALKRSAELTVTLQANTPRVKFTNQRERLAVTSLALALSHRDGIHILTRAGANAPAFALLRPMYEALMRGIWAATCASDAQGEDAYTKGYLPKFDTVIKALNRNRSHGGIYGELNARVWDGYSDYAHGGMRQIIRWAGQNVSEPEHTDDEILDLLHFVDMHAIQAHMALTDIAGQALTSFGILASSLTNDMRARKATTAG